MTFPHDAHAQSTPSSFFRRRESRDEPPPFSHYLPPSRPALPPRASTRSISATTTSSSSHLPSGSSYEPPSPLSPRRPMTASGGGGGSSSVPFSTLSEPRDPPRLDVKRLLSRPANVSSPSSSTLSSASSSPISGSPYHPPSARSEPAAHARRAYPSPIDHEREQQQRLRQRASHATMRGGQTTPTASSFSLSQQQYTQPSKSAGATPSEPSLPSHSLRRLPSQSFPGLRASRRPATSPMPSPTTPLSFTTSSEWADATMTTMMTSSTAAPLSPRGLTPAGAIKHAYKEQEKRRSQLESSSSSMMMGTRASSERVGVVGYPASASPSPVLFSPLDRPDSVSSGPAVLGSTGGRLVARGSPADDGWAVGAHDPRARSVASGTGSSSTGPTTTTTTTTTGARSLVRKVSGRFRKAITPTRSDEGGREEGRERRRLQQQRPPPPPSPPGLQERRSLSLPYARRAAGALRVDTDPTGQRDRSEPALHSGRTPVSGGGFAPGEIEHSKPPPPRKLVKERRERVEDPLLDPTSTLSSSSAPPTSTSTSSGGKLWKLMKRLSTGGLKDRFQADAAAPPVPELPKDVVQQQKRRTFDPAHISSPREAILAPAPAPPPPAPLVIPLTPPAAAARSHAPKARPSTDRKRGTPLTATTRSSSPDASSENASAHSRFFRGAQSARSSTSSYGEEVAAVVAVPPLPASTVSAAGGAYHSPLFRATSRPEENTECVSPTSLPPPPSKRSGSGTPQQQQQASRTASAPQSPAVVASGATTSSLSSYRSRLPRAEFGRPSVDSSGSLSASAVPATTTKRSQSAHAHSVISVPRHHSHHHPHPPHHPPAPVAVLPVSDTPKPRPRPRAKSNAPAPITFRAAVDSAAAAAAAKTEQEKKDMWADLLDRSARAGGTLKLGAQGGEVGLESDGLSVNRLSGYSELAS